MIEIPQYFEPLQRFYSSPIYYGASCRLGPCEGPDWERNKCNEWVQESMKEEMVEKPASKSPQGTELEQGSQHVFKSMGVEKMGFKRKSMTSFQTQ